ncbi:MAG: TfoX/Sxy family protein [Acidobacteria bacterium]|nr:TfoX/Sxy family protein [Acidobacteriota bacterium]MCA1652226.1 TfoX/Sxy family protein [Acidobacteriota bacterium]
MRTLRVSPGFKAFVLDQLADVGVAGRPMFGGVGLYHDDLFFGIIANDVLYLKVDDLNRADYQAVDSSPFRPYPDRAGTMEYFAVPVEILESAPELGRWAAKSIAVAGRAAECRKPRARRRTR